MSCFLVGSHYSIFAKDGTEEFGQLRIVLTLDILVIEPASFLVVELGSGLAALFDVEQSDQFVHAHDILIIARIPAQKREEVYHCFRQITAFTITFGYISRLGIFPLQRKYGKSQTIAIAFAQLTVSFGLQQQCQMGKSRHRIFPTESTIEQYMKWCTGQPLLTTYHMAHFHQMVVHDIGQMVGGQVVGTFIQHLVIEDGRVDHHSSANQVVHFYVHIRLHEETNHILRPLGNETLHFFGRQCQRVAHLPTSSGIVLEVGHLGSPSFQFLRRIEGDICPSRIQ